MGIKITTRVFESLYIQKTYDIRRPENSLKIKPYSIE
jgi:hypothetical protein